MPTLIEMLNIFTNLPAVLASIGLVLATSSFISGLQMVKAKGVLERKIHKGNGIATAIIFIALALLSFINYGVNFWSFSGWLSGALLIAVKITIVRSRRRRAFKYVSWLGASLIIMWLYIVYIHIPV